MTDAPESDELADLLRSMSVRVDALQGGDDVTDEQVRELRRRFVAAVGAARHDPVLARRRLAAIDADLPPAPPVRDSG